MYMCVYIYIYIYIYTQALRPPARDVRRPAARALDSRGRFIIIIMIIIAIITIISITITIISITITIISIIIIIIMMSFGLNLCRSMSLGRLGFQSASVRGPGDFLVCG